MRTTLGVILTTAWILMAPLADADPHGAVAAAETAIGKPYEWGAAGPEAFDCSGLVVWAYAQIGVGLPRTSQQQAVGGQPVADRNDLLPGDVITYYPDASHVALYIGHGDVIHASTYGIPVKRVPIDAAGPVHNMRRYTRKDTTVTYARGLDYAGGRPSGHAITAAGYQFVCRYLSDGGPSLPGKQLLPDEAADLIANGIAIVSNWETTADRMLAGHAAGVADATTGRDWVRHCGGPDGVIYFSADFDATEAQQAPINDYLRGAASVIGAQNVGIYGGYWVVSRALDAGVAAWAWQTEAWSGTNRDPRINLLQRNSLGYQYVAGVQCDMDEAHTQNYGQWKWVTKSEPSKGPLMALTDQQQADMYNAIMGTAAAAVDNETQLRGPGQLGWPQLGQNAQGEDLTLVDAVAALRQDVANLHASIITLVGGAK